jgi:transposase
MDRDSLQRLLARGLSLAEIGRRFDRHETTIAYWVKQFDLRAVNTNKHAAKGGLAREDLEALVDDGCSIADIAARVGRSKATVRHWLRRYEIETQNGPGRRRSPEAIAARDAGLLATTMVCPRHGETPYVLDGRGYYRCRRCRAEAVSRRRRKMKAILVAEAGGACCICGYRGNMRALHFHHVRPSEKRLEINAKGIALSLETLRAEARKCVLLCSNCHAEVEDGVVSIQMRTQAIGSSSSDPG